jgi:hypothetical protein
MPISADKDRVIGKFYVPLEGEYLPADQLMSHIIKIRNLVMIKEAKRQIDNNEIKEEESVMN